MGDLRVSHKHSPCFLCCPNATCSFSPTFCHPQGCLFRTSGLARTQNRYNRHFLTNPKRKRGQTTYHGNSCPNSSLDKHILEALLRCSPRSMSTAINIDPILTAYPVLRHSVRAHYLAGAGGFSGARFWRIESASGTFCLRRWPVEYPRTTELGFIHEVLHYAKAQGFPIAAVPLPNINGTTYVSHSGHLWELAPWMPGKPELSKPPLEARVFAAMQCLANFHRATQTFAWDLPTTFRQACPSTKPSPGLHNRIELSRTWMTGRASQLEIALRRGIGWPAMEQRASQLLQLLPELLPKITDELATSRNAPVPLQPCIRDVWPDHLLFDGNRVTGLIDFGSMGIDNVACDIARLLGGFATGDSTLWHVGLQAYTSIRSLSQAESDLASVFDQSGVLFGALNWAAWVFLDQRVFEEPQAVLDRMDALLARLEQGS